MHPMHAIGSHPRTPIRGISSDLQGLVVGCKHGTPAAPAAGARTFRRACSRATRLT